METNTQSHKQMLQRISTLGRVAGWAMIGIGLVQLIYLPYHISWNTVGALSRRIVYFGYANSGDNILSGLIILGLVQLIRYVCEEKSEPGWFLRNGHIILCLYALFLLIVGGMKSYPFLSDYWNNFKPEHMIQEGHEFFILLMILLPIITKAICFLGIAALLRNVLPVLAESKTLA